jgi:hypothetical protein
MSEAILENRKANKTALLKIYVPPLRGQILCYLLPTKKRLHYLLQEVGGIFRQDLYNFICGKYHKATKTTTITLIELHVSTGFSKTLVPDTFLSR